MIDMHSHILPGVDDGARSIEESLMMIADAARDGVTAMAATPHVRTDYPITAHEMEAGVERLQHAAAAASLEVDILPGGEVDVEELRRRDGKELARFGLGGNRRYLLLEFPYRGTQLSLQSDVTRLVASGITPVLAHPERNDEIQKRPADLESLVHAGALVQLTASSITGAFGRVARETALALLGLELAHLAASDAHSPSVGRASLRAAVAALDDPIAEWLMRDVPAAIVSDTELPERPLGAATRQRRGLRVWRR
jgi:protein-tyrosine phosphatase